jgi:hypothetical protein
MNIQGESAEQVHLAVDDASEDSQRIEDLAEEFYSVPTLVNETQNQTNIISNETEEIINETINETIPEETQVALKKFNQSSPNGNMVATNQKAPGQK